MRTEQPENTAAGQHERGDSDRGNRKRDSGGFGFVSHCQLLSPELSPKVRCPFKSNHPGPATARKCEQSDNDARDDKGDDAGAGFISHKKRGSPARRISCTTESPAVGEASGLRPAGREILETHSHDRLPRCSIVPSGEGKSYGAGSLGGGVQNSTESKTIC